MKKLVKNNGKKKVYIYSKIIDLPETCFATTKWKHTYPEARSSHLKLELSKNSVE